MKKLIGLALLTTTLFGDSPAESITEPVDAPVSPDQAPIEEESSDHGYGSFALTEVKMGYLRFGDRKLRHHYNKGVLDVQLTSSICFWKPLYAYLGVEYIGCDGRLHPGHQKIQLRMVPVSLGVQYIQPITFDLKYYLTAGARYFFAHQWTPSKSLTRNGVGGFANTGFLYYLNPHVVFDFFGEYSYKKLHFQKMGGSLQVGGLILGAGIGYFW